MSNPLLLLPDFLLILLGWVLCRRTSLNRPVWDAVERLVYFLLFPVLLFNSIVKSPLHAAEVASLAAATLGVLAAGIMRRARRPRTASTPTSRSRSPSASAVRRASPGWRS